MTKKLSRFSSPSPLLGTIHGLSPALYGHLPRRVKVQLARQKIYIDDLIGTLLGRLEKANSAPTVEGGCFYNDGPARDLHLVCKSITRASSSFKINMLRTQRHDLIKALFTFVVRHSDPTLIYGPKALRSTSKLLSALLRSEYQSTINERSYQALKEMHLVPNNEKTVFPNLDLDWKALYAFVRTILNWDHDRRLPTHHTAAKPLSQLDVLELVSNCAYFFEKNCLPDLLQTVFPLLSATPGDRVESLLAKNPQLYDYLLRLSKIEDLVFLSHIFPVLLGPESVDWADMIDQIMEVWNLVPQSRAWDRAVVTLLKNISTHNVIRQWKPNHVRIILDCSLRQLNLATAGTQLAALPRSASPFSLFDDAKYHGPLGRVLGNLIVNILASDHYYLGQNADLDAETPTAIFMDWLSQIENYLHPNQQNESTVHLKNILLGVVDELYDRFRSAVNAQDFAAYKAGLPSQTFSKTAEPQGSFDLIQTCLAHSYHGRLDYTLIREPVWDALCARFDQLRVHLMNGSLGLDMSFLLAYLRPSYIESSIFPRITFAFENPMLGSHITSSIKLLTQILPLLLSTQPAAAARLPQLLDLLLSHIDPNDTKKSKQTFGLILALMVALNERKKKRANEAINRNISAIQVPSDLAGTLVEKCFNELKKQRMHEPVPTLHRPFESQTDETPIDTELLESELISLESFVSEWLVMFFDRTLEFIDGIPSGTTASNSMIQCLHAVVEFSGDGALFNQLLRRLTAVVEATHGSKTDLNPVIDAFARNQPLKTLQACFDSWLVGVKKRAQSKSVTSLVESEVDSIAWKLDVLRLICTRFGAPIIAHEKALLAVIAPLLKDNDNHIRHAASSVLAAALGPIKPTCNFQSDPAKTISSFTDVLLNQASFYEASQDTITLASRWIDSFATPILQTLEECTIAFETAPLASDASAAAAKDVGVPKDFPEQLRVLYEFISALGPILPLNETTSASLAVSGESERSLTASQQVMLNTSAELSELAIEEETASKRKATLLPTKLSVLTALTRESSLPDSLRMLRRMVIAKTQAFINAAIVTGKCVDVKLARRAFKLLFQALSHNGAKETKWADKLSRFTATSAYGASEEKAKSKKKKEDSEKHVFTLTCSARYFTSPYNPYYTQLRASKVTTMLQNRWSSVRNKLAFGMAEIEALSSFITVEHSSPVLAQSKKLLEVLLSSTPRFGGATPFLNNIILKLLSEPLKPAQPTEPLIIFSLFLAMPVTLGNTTANWKNVNNFVQTFRGLHVHDHADLQRMFQALFTSIVVSLNAIPATPLVDQGFFTAYTQLMDTLVSDLTTPRPSTHWRYHIYTLAFISLFQRKNIHTPKVKPEIANSVSEEQTEPSLSEHPGLDGLTILKALIPVLTDVLPTARAVAAGTIRKMLSWAQEAGDKSHAVVISQVLNPSILDALLSNATADRQQPARRTLDSLDSIAKRIGSYPDPFSVGDAEWGVTSPYVSVGTFSLTSADFWYRIFNSLNFVPDTETAAQQVVQYLMEKLEQNLRGGKTTPSPPNVSATSSPNPTPTTSEESSQPSTTASSLSSKPQTETGSVSPQPPSHSSSPSPDHTDEMESYFYCLAEMLTGFTRAFPELAQTKIWNTLFNFGRISSNRTSSLFFALAYLVHHKVSLEIFEKAILEPIFTKHKGKLFGDHSAFDIEARLLLIITIYQESRLPKLDPLVKLVQCLFIEKRVASLPKPQIRTASLHALTLLSGLLMRVGKSNANAWDVHQRAIDQLIEPIGKETVDLPTDTSASVSTIATTATGSQVPVTPEDRIKSTFIAWVGDCLTNRVEILTHPDYWTKVTKLVLELTVDDATANAKAASLVFIKLSQMIVEPISELEQVELVKQIENVKQLARNHPRWKARHWVIMFLRFFVFNHAILMAQPDKNEFIEWSKCLVEDSNADVRMSATAAISSLVRSLNPSDETMKGIATYFIKMAASNNRNAKTKLRKDKDDAPASSETIAALTAATFGLVALAGACPFTVPSWLPAVVVGLQSLSSHSNGTIATTASEGVAQFWKTHRDEWHFHQTRFTEDQLRILEDKPIPSYYA